MPRDDQLLFALEVLDCYLPYDFVIFSWSCSFLRIPCGGQLIFWTWLGCCAVNLVCSRSSYWIRFSVDPDRYFKQD